MALLIEIFVALIALWFVWRFVSSIWNPRSPAEPIDEPFAGVGAPRRRGPKDKAGAVALEEPDEGENLSFPPRRQ